MSIRNQIQSQIVTSMKSRDQKRLDAFRFLFSQIRYKEIDAKKELTDEETVKLFAGRGQKTPGIDYSLSTRRTEGLS